VGAIDLGFSVRSLTVLSEEHPEDQADQGGEEEQQKSAQRQRHRALLFRLRFGDAEGSDEAFHQKIQQFHDVSQYRPRRHCRLLLLLIPLSPNAGREGGMSDQEAPESALPHGRDLPDPATEALDEPHLTAEDLEREIGDSEAWDEASEEKNTPTG
jgi:hypothetical protein